MTMRAEPRRFEAPLFLIWAVATSLLCIHVIGAKIFLIYLYGWNKVRHEHLSIVRMSKSAPWLVSNGDMISRGHFIHWLISLGCWFAIFLLTYPIIRLALPRQR